jgi:hypothetical protein
MQEQWSGSGSGQGISLSEYLPQKNKHSLMKKSFSRPQACVPPSLWVAENQALAGSFCFLFISFF